MIRISLRQSANFIKRTLEPKSERASESEREKIIVLIMPTLHMETDILDKSFEVEYTK